MRKITSDGWSAAPYVYQDQYGWVAVANGRALDPTFATRAEAWEAATAAYAASGEPAIVVHPMDADGSWVGADEAARTRHENGWTP